MANIGQTIIIRTDIFELPQDMGLLSAQVAHIHFEYMRNILTQHAKIQEDHIDIPKGDEVRFNMVQEWLKHPYIFVKQVPNIESLVYFSDLAAADGVSCSSWYDTVYVRLSPTMKKAFPNTLVGISLGPDDSDKIRSVVGDLPLL